MLGIVGRRGTIRDSGCVRRIIAVLVIIGVVGILHALVDGAAAIIVDIVAVFLYYWAYVCIIVVAVTAIDL